MNPLVDFYRCPPEMAPIETQPSRSTEHGFFRFGEAIGFGRLVGGSGAEYPTDPLQDVSSNVQLTQGKAYLPFDLGEVITNLREERYPQDGHTLLQSGTTGAVVQRIYYQLRPLMGVAVRKHLQKLRLSGWENIAFPRWPVDRSADILMERALAAVLKARGERTIPFIWFWPGDAQACAMMTHDVEGRAGIDFCDPLMDLDDQYGIKSAFQLIPEGREEEWRKTAARLRGRGFEVNLHDLNHDGRLFADRDAFLRHARRINDYTREFHCDGFRSGAMYREQGWFHAFEFSYDMSVPNAAHLEPQRGGCCTVMPYFVGNLLELPLTTVQDYSLFHILNDYSTRLWKQQIAVITRHHGLVSVITHPDYLIGTRERALYVELLEHLAELRAREKLWIALPGEINRWWRNRQQMVLKRTVDGWQIDGPDSGRARIAYAWLDGERLVYGFNAEANVPDPHVPRVLEA